MMKAVIAAMMMMSTSAQAAEFFYPSAQSGDQFVAAGLEPITVCMHYIDLEGTGGPQSVVWDCDDYEAHPARSPFFFFVSTDYAEVGSPIKFVGPRWVYRLDGLAWVPLVPAGSSE